MKVTICDSCREQPTGEVSVPVGTQPDPAGGPRERQYEHLDLCARCACAALGLIVNREPDGPGLGANKALVASIRARAR